MMDFIVPILLVVAIIVLHIHTCFTEAVHLNKWRPWLIILLLILTGTWFIYFVSRTALMKLGVQLALIVGLVIYIS
ncbi:TPA: enterochelin ABC transporter [Neisseria polysaccharea]|uniref:enterochelin ABC transporter n=1 Tax=Neisseria polysaccharea TaxID=489 RepID=UPI0027DFD805|nr:enterochelin ABC transporter [Neisseria polysaccharea]